MLHNPRRLAMVLLAAHIAATTTARANPAEFDTLAVSRSVQLANVTAFAILAGILHKSGNLALWPNLLPLSVALSGIFGAGAFLSFVISVSSKTSAFLWSSGAVSFMATAYYAMTPESEGWLRHAGIAVFLLMGVPIMYAIPRILANRTNPDTHLINTALEASVLAYRRGRSDTFSDAEYINDASTGTQVGISSAAAPDGTRDIYITFTGTTSHTDWLKTNIRIEDVTYPRAWLCDSTEKEEKNAMVHAGFLAAYASIRDKVWDLVSDFILRTAASGRIVICGHSLGGAVATIAAMDLMCKLEPAQKPKTHIVSFGSPHVGDASFARLFNSRVPHSDRVVTVYDPIPNILTSRYVHVKGAHTLTVPILDNPITAHNPQTYVRAMRVSSNKMLAAFSVALPLVLVVFFLTLFAKISLE